MLSRDPQPTAQERAAFERNELARALKLLHRAGERGLVRVFALQLGEQAQTKPELAMLVDHLRGLGEQELSLLAYRRGAQNGLVLHDRGYPLASPPQMATGAEMPLVLAIVRQESQFDPRVRSGADARGMMQLVPATAREVAQKAGTPWSEDLLWDPEANMNLGSRYLASLIERFGGSYVMAAAGYNAGPSRPRQWAEFCGDPRDPRIDPVDFIECIPFSETRTYVMNVLSNLHVYRARLAGGEAALEPGLGLRRGSGVSVAANGGPGPGT